MSDDATAVARSPAHAARPRPGWAAHHARRIGRAAATVLVTAWIVFATCVLVLRYIVLPHVGDWRPTLERVASRALGETVTIGSIDASWRGLRPSLALHAIRIVDPAGHETLELPAVQATLSWESLAVLDLRLASLEIDGLDLQVRRDADGQLYVAGFPVKRRTTPDNRLGEWVLAQDRIAIRNARLTWRDELPLDATADAAPREVGLSDVAVVLVRDGWRHRLAIRVAPPAALAAPLDLRARIDHPLFATRLADPANWRGTVYASVATGDLARWRGLLPIPERLAGGRGRMRLWVDFSTAADAFPGVLPAPAATDDPEGRADRVPRIDAALAGRFRGLVTDFAFDDVAIDWAPGDRIALAALDGRVVATQDATTQRLAVRSLAIRPVAGPALAPANVTVERTIDVAHPDREHGTATLDALDLAHALALVPGRLLPAATERKLLAYRPRGELERLSLDWTGPVTHPAGFRFDARFARFGIDAQPPTSEAIRSAARTIVDANGLVRKPRPAFGQPGVDHLSGSITATRANRDGVVDTTASIALDGSDVRIDAPGLFDDPDLRLATLRARVDLHASGDDVELRVADAAFENADLAGTANLTFRRGPHSGSEGRGWVDVDARLARGDVARVPRYVPNVVGEPARVYLRRSLVAGRIASATFRMRGSLEQLDIRAQADSLAEPYHETLGAALTHVRDAPADRPPAEPPAPAAAATSASTSTSDAPILHAVVTVHDATYLYGPARSVDEIAAAARRNGTPLPQPLLPTVAWPPFEGVDADVIFDHAHMTVLARAARYGRFRLRDVRIDLPAIADPRHVLRAVGRGRGPLQELVRYTNDGPMARWTRDAFANTRTSGDATLALALDLPLGHARDADVLGTIGLEGDDVSVLPNLPSLRRITGRVDFSDKGVAIDGLTATAFGGPLRVDAKTGPDGLIEVVGAGTIEARALRDPTRLDGIGADAAYATNAADTTDAGAPAGFARLLPRLAERLDGSAAYRATLHVRSKRAVEAASGTPAAMPPTGHEPDLLVESTLAGLSIDLPAPFGKTAAESWPLRIALDRDMAASTGYGANRETLRVTLADKARAEIARQRDRDGQMVVTRAAYVLGDAPLPADGPTTLVVAVPTLDLDAWRDVARQVVPPRPTAPVEALASSLEALAPARVVLRTNELRVAHRRFDRVDLDARRNPSGWAGDVTADQVAGHVAYSDVSGTVATRNGVAPASTGRLVARLTRLIVPEAETSEARVREIVDATRERDFPAIDLVADDFELRGKRLGRLEVLANNVGDDARRTWQVERFGLTLPEARVTGHGAWDRGTGGEHTQVAFDLDASDVGRLLDRFGVVGTIGGGTANMTGEVGWDGGPATIDFATMQGRLRLDAGRGRFLKADPGIAKLLGVLSLQSIPRRLMLDFSDVFEAGFAFDSITADATIAHGVASTDDFVMKGVQANVEMSGSADLQHETSDLHVKVLPEINAGAASLAAAIVNPVIGLSTFLAQYLFKDRIAEALSFEYNVSGPWKKPVVVKIDHEGRATRVVPKKTETTRSGTVVTQPVDVLPGH